MRWATVMMTLTTTMLAILPTISSYNNQHQLTGLAEEYETLATHITSSGSQKKGREWCFAQSMNVTSKSVKGQDIVIGALFPMHYWRNTHGIIIVLVILGTLINKVSPNLQLGTYWRRYSLQLRTLNNLVLAIWFKFQWFRSLCTLDNSSYSEVSSQHKPGPQARLVLWFDIHQTYQLHGSTYSCRVWPCNTY